MIFAACSPFSFTVTVFVLTSASPMEMVSLSLLISAYFSVLESRSLRAFSRIGFASFTISFIGAIGPFLRPTSHS